MNDRWQSDDWRGEARRRNRLSEGRARWPEGGGAFDEERAFGPPRGAYDEDRGYGEAVYQRGERPARVFGERETGADYRSAPERRYWGGYEFGPSEASDWEEQRRAEALQRRARRLGRDGDAYARPGPDRHDRGFWDRMSDEAAAWFGDPYARERRQADHRGVGPKGYRRSDERISEEVHDRLTDDSRLDASAIEVQVQDGEVTLSGSVRDRRDKRLAEDIVEHVLGVRHVQNNLRRAAGGADPAIAEDSVLHRQALKDG